MWKIIALTLAFILGTAEAKNIQLEKAKTEPTKKVLDKNQLSYKKSASKLNEQAKVAMIEPKKEEKKSAKKALSKNEKEKALLNAQADKKALVEKKKANKKEEKKENKNIKPKIILTSLEENKKVEIKKIEIKVEKKTEIKQPTKALSPLIAKNSSSVSNLRQSVINKGMRQLGVPYRFGGNNPSSGFDCSGLMTHIFSAHGIQLPRNSHEQYLALSPVKQPQAGDLVFFSHGGHHINHVGLYLGNHKMLHAPSSGKRVSIQDMDNPYWKKRYVGARSALKYY